jgi:hypothetical protein
MDYAEDRRNPVTNSGGVTTERAVAGLVIGCLVALILIRRGFRGVGIPGVGSARLG